MVQVIVDPRAHAHLHVHPRVQFPLWGDSAIQVCAILLTSQPSVPSSSPCGRMVQVIDDPRVHAHLHVHPRVQFPLWEDSDIQVSAILVMSQPSVPSSSPSKLPRCSCACPSACASTCSFSIWGGTDIQLWSCEGHGRQGGTFRARWIVRSPTTCANAYCVRGCMASSLTCWWNSVYHLGLAVLTQAYRWISGFLSVLIEERLACRNDITKLHCCHGIMSCMNCCAEIAEHWSKPPLPQRDDPHRDRHSHRISGSVGRLSPSSIQSFSQIPTFPCDAVEENFIGRLGLMDFNGAQNNDGADGCNDFVGPDNLGLKGVHVPVDHREGLREHLVGVKVAGFLHRGLGSGSLCHRCRTLIEATVPAERRPTPGQAFAPKFLVHPEPLSIPAFSCDAVEENIIGWLGLMDFNGAQSNGVADGRSDFVGPENRPRKRIP